jgi:hypothetical protein
MIQLDGREIDAPGFTAASFQQALGRAAAEGLRANRSEQAGAIAVISGDNVYEATRSTCTCIAGRYAKPCKHRALAAFLLDGLRLDISHATGVRLRLDAVGRLALTDETGVTVQPGPLTKRVRQGWTADRTWMKAYGIDA